MTISEWLTCDEPDLMLEELMGKISKDQLVMFVRRCWDRITPSLQVPHNYTVVEQFEQAVPGMNDHDAVIYASEAALKAAGMAANMREEQRAQAELLRQIVAYPFSLNIQSDVHLA
jgi:hypothetical protein